MISSIKDGRASIKPTGEDDIYIPCDVLIVAIGQNIETRHFEEAGIPVERGKIVTKSTGTFENMPGVFAGGDCASGPASVIKQLLLQKLLLPILMNIWDTITRFPVMLRFRKRPFVTELHVEESI